MSLDSDLQCITELKKKIEDAERELRCMRQQLQEKVILLLSKFRRGGSLVPKGNKGYKANFCTVILKTTSIIHIHVHVSHGVGILHFLP